MKSFFVYLILLCGSLSFLVFLNTISSAKETEAIAQATSEIQESFHKPYKLNRVVDGDTIVANDEKIRIWGINTPEKNNPHFLAAKLLLESLLSKGDLRCKFIEKDRYQRSVMHCLIDGLDVGSMMVQTGMAKDYSKYSGDYYQREEDLAKSKGRGIWSSRANP